MAAPTLRFKEFDGCWVEKIISEIADVRGGKRLPKGYSLQEENNGFPYITVTDMENGTVNLEKIRYVPLEAIDQIKRYRISVDEIYISVAGTLGLVGIIPQELNNANLTENADKLTNIKCNQFYLLHYLNNGSLSKLIDSVSTIGAQPKLALYAIQGMPIFLPSLDEQIQIANFLSAVDEKISQLSQKLHLLSQYKQGMMQKLFSQKMRFKAEDGSEFGKWKETHLHSFLCESLIKGGKGDKAKKLTVKLWGKGVVPKNEAFQGSENTQYYKRSAGQLIYGKLDFLNCAFGLIPEYLDGFESTIDAPAFDIDNKKVHPYFLINRFLQKDFYQKNGEEADGSRKAKRINQSVFLAMQIDLPSLEEQSKIANFLSAIDQKIEITSQQIEQAKQWKKGLLQQMFA